MLLRRTALATAALASATVALAPSAAMGDSSFPAQGEVLDLAAGGGYVVWERRTPTGSRLTMRFGGLTRDLNVPTASNYAGVDLGRDSRGRLVAVFSRCGRKRYSCDLFTYRLGSGRQTRLRALSKRRCDEFGPAIDRGVVSFGRGTRRRGRRAVCAGGVYAKGRRRRSKVRRVARTVPGTTDVARGRVVFTFTTKTEDCCRDVDLGVVRLGRKRAKVRSPFPGMFDECSDCTTLDDTAPVLDGRDLYWQPFFESSPGPISRLRGGEREVHTLEGDAPEGDITFTVSQGTLFLSERFGVIQRVDRPAFR